MEIWSNGVPHYYYSLDVSYWDKFYPFFAYFDKEEAYELDLIKRGGAHG